MDSMDPIGDQKSDDREETEESNKVSLIASEGKSVSDPRNEDNEDTEDNAPKDEIQCSTQANDSMDTNEELSDELKVKTQTNGADSGLKPNDTKSDTNCDQKLSKNSNDCEDSEDIDSNVDNRDQNSNDNQLNTESNDSTNTNSTNDSNDSNDKFLGFDDEEEEDNLYGYDPTPSSAYPSIKWHSLQQLQQREYGKLIKPGNKRPFDTYESQSFRRYAYNSLYFFQRLELMAKFEEHNGCVNCLNFNNSGDRLISGSDDLRIAVWDWQKSRLVLKYHSGHSSNVFQSRWCDDNHIVSCARDGQVRICNINRSGTTTVSNKLAQHKGAAHKLTLTAPQVILSCGEDAVVFEIDLRADKPNKLLFVKNANEQRVPLYSIHSNLVFNPLQFAVSGRDPFVRIYDRRFLSNAETNVSPVLSLCPEKLKQSKHSVTCAQYNPTGSQLLSTYNDEDIYTFNTKTGALEHSYSGHRNNATVKGCAWFGDDFIVSGSDDGYVYGWDSQTQHIVMSLYADENGVVNCIEPHPTAPIMATSGLDDDVKVWVPSANEWPQTLKGIKQRICTNVKERQRSHRRSERLGEEGFDGLDGSIDPSMLYMIIRHMRRRSQRTRIGNNENDEEEDDTDTDSEADNGPHECIQS